MNKKVLSILFIVLIVSMPIVFSAQLASQEEYDKRVDNAYDAAIKKRQDALELSQKFDSGILKTLESIAAIAYTICRINSAIDSILNAVSSLIGLFGKDSVCCKVPLEIEKCQQLDQRVANWKKPFKKLQGFCCIVNCGWCTGQSCGRTKGVDMSKMSLGAIPDVMTPKTPGVSAIDNTGQNNGIGQFHLSPYDNIYTAVGCMCPTAVMFNIRKLKTIYQTYYCCVEQSTANFQSTEQCDHYLDTATCMYYEGSLYKMLVNVLMSFGAKLIAKLHFEKIFEYKMVRCMLVLLDLWQTKDVIMGVKSAFDWTKNTFDEPTCEDLGFEEVNDINKAKAVLKNSGKNTDDIMDEKFEQIKSKNGFYFGTVQKPTLRVEAEKDIGYFISRELSGPEREELNKKGIKDKDITSVSGGTFIIEEDTDTIVSKYPEILENLGIGTTTIDTENVMSIFNRMDKDQIRSVFNIVGPQTIHTLIQDSYSNGESQDSSIDPKVTSAITTFMSEDVGIKDFGLYLNSATQKDISIDEYLYQEPIMALERNKEFLENKRSKLSEGIIKIPEYNGQLDDSSQLQSYISGLSRAESEKWLEGLDDNDREAVLKTMQDFYSNTFNGVIGEIREENLEDNPAGAFDIKGVDALKERGISIGQFANLLTFRASIKTYDELEEAEKIIIKDIIDNSNNLEFFRQEIQDAIDKKPVFLADPETQIKQLEKKIEEARATIPSEDEKKNDWWIKYRRYWNGWSEEGWFDADTKELDKWNKEKTTNEIEAIETSIKDWEEKIKELREQKKEIDAKKAEEIEEINQEIEEIERQIQEAKTRPQSTTFSQEEMDKEKLDQLESYIRSLNDPELLEEFLRFKEDVTKAEEFKKKLEERQKEFILNKIKDYIKEQAKYEMAYQLLSMTLGNFAYDMIAEKCEQDWQASESQYETAISYLAPGINDNQEEERDEPISQLCKDLKDKTSVAVDAKRIGTEYEYSYSITSCKENIEFLIYLEGITKENLDSGRISKGSDKSYTEKIQRIAEYDKICAEIIPGETQEKDIICSEI